MIEPRLPGENTPRDTRADANESVDREKRYKQILGCLSERGDSTAKEIAVWRQLAGLIPTSERNFTAPRLTEMSKKGWVEPIGKKKCWYTGKTVTVYGLREGVNG